VDPLIQQQRQNLLNQMNQIERMELGALAEEVRSRIVDGREVISGTYYKHQEWIDGRNKSRRVQPEEAESFRVAIEGRQHFEDLASRFIELTVAQTRAEVVSEIKKKPTKSAKRSSKKPKPS
jgi:hypothetical protein